MHDTLHCAVVAVISLETDGGCGQSHFALRHFNSLYAVQRQFSGPVVKVEESGGIKVQADLSKRRMLMSAIIFPLKGRGQFILELEGQDSCLCF